MEHAPVRHQLRRRLAQPLGNRPSGQHFGHIGAGFGIGRDTSRLKRGMRAFTIKVDVASGVSGFLRPNDLVDICWTGTGDQINRGFTQLIQPGVEIIAIDQSATGEITGASVARTVTVQITPQDVALLAQAQTTGKLSLSLVGEGDDTVSGEIQVDQRQLLGISEPEPVVA